MLRAAEIDVGFVYPETSSWKACNQFGQRLRRQQGAGGRIWIDENYSVVSFVESLFHFAQVWVKSVFGLGNDGVYLAPYYVREHVTILAVHGVEKEHAGAWTEPRLECHENESGRSCSGQDAQRRNST